MLPLRRVAGALTGALLVAAPSVASAQPTITSNAAFPDRIVGNVDQGTGTRVSPFDPYGVSYSDCAENMALRFDLAVQGFSSGEQLQIWGSTVPTDCTMAAERTGTPPACWPLSAPLTSVSSGNQSLYVRVQDLVGNQGSAGTRATTYTALGPTACLAQATEAAVPMYVFFMAIDSSNNVVGSSNAYRYTITTDLVGPAPPAAQPLTVGDGFLTANWTANADSDTIGYDVFMNPAAGSSSDAGSSSADSGPGVECYDTGDVGCYTVVGGSGAYDAGASCPVAWVGYPSIFPTAASSSPVTGDIEEDDASADGAAAYSIGAGISTMPAQYLVASTTVPTVYGEPNGSFQVNDLQDETHYDFIVSAVDAEGNIGPPSELTCDFPDKTTDFFQSYRADGGRAGGGCALDPRRLANATPAGALVMGLGILLVGVRRRRRGPLGK